MTVSISKMSIGYYLRDVATGDGVGRDLTSYYTEAKAPTGRWFGAGLEGLPLQDGAEVSRHEAQAVFQDHADPASGEALGRPLMARTESPEGAKTPRGRTAKSTREGVAGFDLTFSPPKSVSALWAMAEPQLQGEIQAAHDQAVKESLRWVEQNVLQSRAGHAGAAHVPVTGMVASLFEHWDSRNGDPQLHTHAVVCNKAQRRSDGQWVTLDSYTLHSHVVAISELYNNLIFDRLHDRIGAIAESRTPGMEASLEDILGASSADDVSGPEQGVERIAHRVELAGVPDSLIEEFSSRAQQIEARKDELVAQWVQNHGREPSNAEVLQLRQQATLESRAPKDSTEALTLPEKVTQWRRRATLTGVDPDQVVRDAVGHPSETITAEMITPEAVQKVSEWTVNDATMRRTVVSNANVRASAERVLRLVRCSTAEQRERLVDEVTTAARQKLVSLTPSRSTVPDVDDDSSVNRGESVFEHSTVAGKYTTSQIMVEERFLIERTDTEDAPSIASGDELESQLDSWRTQKGHKLSEDQASASLEVLSSSAGISSIIGPAGTGKTTTMRAITDIWQAHHGQGSVVGLAPSAVAAGVLSDEIGTATENTAKWLWESVGEGAARRVETEQRASTELADLLHQEKESGEIEPWRIKRIEQLQAQLAQIQADQARYRLRADQLVIIDEASMVATPALAELAWQAQNAGAKVLLVGDPAQLEAVEAGGFLGHVERNLGAATLDKVWRFEQDWEKDASLQLRRGQTAALETYEEQGRLHGQPGEDQSDQAYLAWKADQDAGKASILIASDNATVAELNQRAHVDRVASGQVTVDQTVQLREGTSAGVGEVVLARCNNRSLRDSTGQFITNGTRMTLTQVLPDGSAAAKVESTGAEITLDQSYLADAVELGYATTAHRAQGVTVDTGHAVVSPGLSRELFYVAMTRGRESNDAWVQLDDPQAHAVASFEAGPAAVVSMHEEIAAETPREALAPVLARSAAEKSAHEVEDAEHGWANDLGRAVHEAAYLQWAARSQRTLDWVHQHYTGDQRDQLISSDQWQRLVTADPGLTHAGEPAPDDTVNAILRRCDHSGLHGSGPGGMLPEIHPHGQAQQHLAQENHQRIDSQVTLLCEQARQREPQWYQHLTERCGTEPPQQVLEAVVMWKAVSDQTEDFTLLGKEPTSRDYLRPYWERMQSSLAAHTNQHHSTAETSEAPAVVTQLYPGVDPIDDEELPDFEAQAHLAWEMDQLIGDLPDDYASLEHELLDIHTYEHHPDPHLDYAMRNQHGQHNAGPELS